MLRHGEWGMRTDLSVQIYWLGSGHHVNNGNRLVLNTVLSLNTQTLTWISLKGTSFVITKKVWDSPKMLSNPSKLKAWWNTGQFADNL
jgi:hypothetical protein